MKASALQRNATKPTKEFIRSDFMADDRERRMNGLNAGLKGSNPLSDHDRAVLSRVFNPTLPTDGDDDVAPQVEDDFDDDNSFTTAEHSTTSGIG